MPVAFSKLPVQNEFCGELRDETCDELLSQKYFISEHKNLDYKVHKDGLVGQFVMRKKLVSSVRIDGDARERGWRDRSLN